MSRRGVILGAATTLTAAACSHRGSGQTPAGPESGDIAPPAVARRLYHGRDLGAAFDFLTWFEYAPADAPAFAERLGALRATPEWAYVEHEVEVLVRRG